MSTHAKIRTPRGRRVRAFAKINLTLRVLGVRADGYHELRTTFQALALHDTLTFTPVAGPLQIVCDHPACPVDRRNLVWQAAQRIWRATGRRGAPRDLRVSIRKRIPLQSGLGGGSSDAAAALRALARMWPVDLSADDLTSIAADLGSDVPFFLAGGTTLGLERGNLLFPLPDWPASWVVLAIPDFGVSTADAYRWLDERASVTSRLGRSRRTAADVRDAGNLALPVGFPGSEWVNDLMPAVVVHHPAIGRLARNLQREGAFYAAMSGSGSAVFGLFGTRERAVAAAIAVTRRGCQTQVTRTIGRRESERLGIPAGL